MTLGIAPAQARTELDAFVTAFPYAQLHTGDPGAAGTANVAQQTARQQPAFGTASTSGATTSKTTTAATAWTGAPASETYTAVSFWSAASGGTFGGSIAASGSVLAGGTFTIPAGSCTLTKQNAG